MKLIIIWELLFGATGITIFEKITLDTANKMQTYSILLIIIN